MANCKYCGQPAGFLRHSHKGCAAKFEDGRNQIVAEAIASIQAKADFAALKGKIEAVASRSYIGTDEEKSLLVSAWEKAVDKFLDDDVLDQMEEASLVKYRNHFLLNDTDLDRNGYLTKTAKAGVLRDILEGKTPKRMNFDGTLTLNLQKSEEVVWAFPNTEYLEDKTRREYVGRTSGISIRVAKGVYYRTGAFRGHSVERIECVSLGRGLLVLTNKHIYFQGAAKSFRVPYQKIVSFQPYSDGIGIVRDAANAKAQTFINGDGWFTYNVITNISNL